MIQVTQLRMRTHLELPGLQVSDGATVEPHATRGKVRKLSYHPELDHYSVELAIEDRASKVYFVPRESVGWAVLAAPVAEPEKAPPSFVKK